MTEYIEREGLLAEYDRQHVGPPGKARKLIASFPATDVREVRRGRWIEHNATHVQKCGMYLECSCCHEYTTVLGHLLAFCPNCGAEMDIRTFI